jgi:hypothetical protein
MTTMKGMSSHPAPAPTAMPKEIIKEEAPVEMVPEQEAPLPPQPRLFNMILRDYEESPPRMENGPQELDDLDDLDVDPNEGRSDMNEWFPKDGSNDRD